MRIYFSLKNFAWKYKLINIVILINAWLQKVTLCVSRWYLLSKDWLITTISIKIINNTSNKQTNFTKLTEPVVCTSWLHQPTVLWRSPVYLVLCLCWGPGWWLCNSQGRPHSLPQWQSTVTWAWWNTSCRYIIYCTLLQVWRGLSLTKTNIEHTICKTNLPKKGYRM